MILLVNFKIAFFNFKVARDEYIQGLSLGYLAGLVNVGDVLNVALNQRGHVGARPGLASGGRGALLHLGVTAREHLLDPVDLLAGGR
mgnify:CR=1 FL=1